MGGSSSRAFSISLEQAVGDDYMRQLRAVAPIVNDAEINDYIQHLGFKLVENNHDAQDRRFSFFIIEENSINAFALPGGYIGINTGLITQSDNESELASVLAHEVAHVTQRHLARRIELQNQLSLPSLAAFAAAILIAASSDNADTGIGALVGAQGLAQQAIINHTRSNEAEADRIGIATLYNAGFDPQGAISFFEKMQQSSRYYLQAPEFLRTHPLSRSRITDARLRAKNYQRSNVQSRPIYSLIKEKIKANTQKVNSVTVAQATKKFNNGDYRSPAEQYGFAIFMIRAREFDLTEKVLKSLRFTDPTQASYAIALAKLNVERKTPNQSIPTIKQLLAQSPTNQALVEALAQLYMADNNFAEARDLLLANVHMTEHAPYLLKLLAEAQEGAGYRAEVYETEGNYLLSMGDLTGARIQFEQALNFHTDDPYSRSRINSQIQRIREFIRQRSLRH